MNAPNAAPDTKPTRPRSAVGEALMLYREAVEHCEAVYSVTQGEETDEQVAAEARRDLTAKQALGALARYRRSLSARKAEVKVEREALARFEADTDDRIAWADAEIAKFAKVVEPERTKLTVGTRTIKLKHTAAVVTVDGFDPKALPAAWRREKPEHTVVVPAVVELDKNAAKDDLLLGLREGVPPSSGWYEIEHHGRRFVTVSPDGAVYLAEHERAESHLVEQLGLSIDPQPGLDVLRWVPAPRGVLLQHRTHVTVE